MHVKPLFAKMYALTMALFLCLLVVSSVSATAPIAKFNIRNDVTLSETGVEEIDEGTTLFLDGSLSEAQAEGESIVKYEWALRDDNAVTTEPMQYSISEGDDITDQASFRDLKPGTYEITLTVSNDNGEATSYSRVITVVSTESSADSTYFIVGIVVLVAVGGVAFFLVGSSFKLSPGRVGGEEPGPGMPMEAPAAGAARKGKAKKKKGKKKKGKKRKKK